MGSWVGRCNKLSQIVHAYTFRGSTWKPLSARNPFHSRFDKSGEDATKFIQNLIENECIADLWVDIEPIFIRAQTDRTSSWTHLDCRWRWVQHHCSIFSGLGEHRADCIGGIQFAIGALLRGIACKSVRYFFSPASFSGATVAIGASQAKNRPRGSTTCGRIQTFAGRIQTFAGIKVHLCSSRSKWGWSWVCEMACAWGMEKAIETSHSLTEGEYGDSDTQGLSDHFRKKC